MSCLSGHRFFKGDKTTPNAQSFLEKHIDHIQVEEIIFFQIEALGLIALCMEMHSCLTISF